MRYAPSPTTTLTNGGATYWAPPRIRPGEICSGARICAAVIAKRHNPPPPTSAHGRCTQNVHVRFSYIAYPPRRKPFAAKAKQPPNPLPFGSRCCHQKNCRHILRFANAAKHVPECLSHCRTFAANHRVSASSLSSSSMSSASSSF